jgi:hypothetical protein
MCSILNYVLHAYSAMIENMAIRRVQAYHGEKSLTFVLPKDFAIALGIGKGDYLKVTLDDQKLIIQKAEV